MKNNAIQLDVDAPISRELLYQLVWSEPMLKVAARFGLSSSYMARVCTALNVPRPAAGYWGKLAVGRAPPRLALPQARSGDELTWIKGQAVSVPARFTPASKATPARIRARVHAAPERAQSTQSGRVNSHPLIGGMKPHFEKGRFTHDLGYLRPDKKTLVDVIVTRATLDRALSFANTLFQALEAREYGVSFARNYKETQRAEPDVLEQPPGPLGGYCSLWSPQYPTVVYVGEVRFGLTVIEMAEEAQARYVNGKYIRESELKPSKQRYSPVSTWSTKHQFTTSRLRLQVYSAFRGTEWKRHWDETKERPLSAFVDEIVTTLEKSVDQVWAADIAYIPMARGFVYLVAIIDGFTRKVLAWRLSNSMAADFCVEALEGSHREVWRA